ncbi:MAG: hypothetical protein H0W70_05280 [Actinobacteria bacterium]|nr:hypothetical protein [Actinomycetota bacterium]
MRTTKPSLAAPAVVRDALRDWRWLGWGAPLGVYVGIRYAPLGFGVETLLGAVLGGFVTVWAFRKPVRALTLLIILLPFHTLATALVYRVTGSVAIARDAAYWKESVGLAAAAAIFVRWRREHHGVDWIDRVAIAYLMLGLVYLFAPGLFVTNVVGSLFDRAVGFRGDVFYVLLLLAARHARFTEAELRRAVRWFLIVAGIAAAVAIVEFYASGFWNDVAVNFFRIPRYRVEVLRISPALVNPDDLRVYGEVAGRQYLRVGSIELSFLTTAFYLALALAFAVDRFSRLEQFKATRAALGLAILGLALLFTQTRSAIVTAIVAVVLVVRRDRTRSERARVRGTAIILVMVAAIIPIAAAGGLLSRFTNDSGSSASHESSGRVGYTLLAHYPLGRGLSTAAGSGQRAEIANAAVTESQFLQIGTQLGVVGLALWLLTLGGAAVRVQRSRSRIGTPDAALVASAVTAAAAGFTLGSYLHQSLIAYTVAWTFCIFLGAALGAADTAPPVNDPYRA